MHRVLVVEDEWLIAMDLGDQLKAGGFDVAGPAPSVAKAIALIESEHIDLGIIDINLGGASSYPVAEALNERDIPFVFLSGYANFEMRPEFRNYPLLSKPVPNTVLLSKIRSLLEPKRPQE